jgi:hypothetical protein
MKATRWGGAVLVLCVAEIAIPFFVGVARRLRSRSAKWDDQGQTLPSSLDQNGMGRVRPRRAHFDHRKL